MANRLNEHGERKVAVTYKITPTAKQMLRRLSREKVMSRSGIVEHLIRSFYAQTRKNGGGRET